MAMKKWTDKDLEKIYDRLAESVLSMSDVEIVDELTSAGVDCSKETARIRQLIERSRIEGRKQALKDADKEYQRQISVMRDKHYDLPSDPSHRRELLISALARRPDVKSALTVQFRNFESLSDDDIELALKQLAELKLL